MNWSALLLPILCAACSTALLAPADPSTAASTERATQDREWSDRQIQQDVESSIRDRFGNAALARAMSAEASIMSKLYRGMPLPPVQQPDGSWKDWPYPTALLIRENGRWHRAQPSGFSPVEPAAQNEIDTLLGSAAFWAEPARVAQGGCTDGGSTLFVIRMPKQQPRVRQGTCGGPPLHARLISGVY
jgi:hypothetical protein